MGSLVDPTWELIDPNPDIHMLFVQFNKDFFKDQLGSVEVKWSKRMTLCAGLCRYAGRLGECTIVLSEPLLKLRPRRDLIETLLHEMIHAYLFVADNNREHDAHGPKFVRYMEEINRKAGTRITIYHSFHDEVNHYKTHIWRCEGSCRSRPPFFGYVKRSMNRKPGPNDTWYADHQRTCGGNFIKISEPEPKTKSKEPKGNVLGDGSSAKRKVPTSKFKMPENKPTRKIDDYFSSQSSSTSSTAGGSFSKKPQPSSTFTPSSSDVPLYTSRSEVRSPVASPHNSPQSQRGTLDCFIRRPGNDFPSLSNGGQKSGRAGSKGSTEHTGTVTVITLDDDEPPKSQPASDDKKDEAPYYKPGTYHFGKETSTSGFVPFSGKGYTLGSSSNSASVKKPRFD